MIKNYTQSISIKQVEIEKKFYEILTATVSHEMRTPLKSMLALLQNMNKYVINPKGLKMLSIIQSSSTMLQFLVNDLLDLFQIKNGKFNKNEQVHDIRKELDNVIELMNIQCEKKNIVLELKIEDRVPNSLVVDI